MNVAAMSLDMTLSALEILALRAGEDLVEARGRGPQSSVRARMEEELDILFCENKISMREYSRRLGELR